MEKEGHGFLKDVGGAPMWCEGGVVEESGCRGARGVVVVFGVGCIVDLMGIVIETGCGFEPW